MALALAAGLGAAASAGSADDREARRRELEAVERGLAATAEARARLDGEVALLRTDRARLAEALVGTAERLRGTEARVTGIEERLALLAGSEAAIRASLNGRRAVLVEVLAALQRMGRRPPPAVLVRAEDMLEAVRAAILLGAVLPELRGEAQALGRDLAELVRLRAAAAAERDALQREAAALAGDRVRLAALVEARQAELSGAERSAGEERARAAQLAARGQTLKDLLARLEAESDQAARAADETRRAALAQARELRDRIAALGGKEPARLAPKVAFAEAKGLLPAPVGGPVVKGFNAPDGLGGQVKGVQFAARPGAVVASPCDGAVVFAGPFRTYGQLLIVNAGGGYYLLLAGLGRVNVVPGQAVLAGEPVGVMGEGGANAGPAGLGSAQPTLYVEFRKDGTPIDPQPWWASTSEKVRG